MAKNKNSKKSKELEKINSTSTNDKLWQLLYITIAVVATFGIFYFMTDRLLDDGSSKDEKPEVVIQQEDILIGESFSLKDKEYFVLYCHNDSEDVINKLSSVVGNYRASRKEPFVYTVDMDLAFNSAFEKDKSNKEATKASELGINGPTLIRFKEGKITQYIEGIDNIINVFK